jgi:beta-galactosidase
MRSALPSGKPTNRSGEALHKARSPGMRGGGHRPKFLISHISHAVQALKEGVDVKGYLHWALTDNLEWAQGYSMRFGLVKVDYETKRRLLRPSALLFKEIAESRDIPDDMDLY